MKLTPDTAEEGRDAIAAFVRALRRGIICTIDLAGRHVAPPARLRRWSVTCAGEGGSCGEDWSCGCGARAMGRGRGEESGDDFGAARSDAANGGDAGDGVAGVFGERAEYFLGEFGAGGDSEADCFGAAEAGAATAATAAAGAAATAADRPEVFWDGDGGEWDAAGRFCCMARMCFWRRMAILCSGGIR